MLPAWRLAPAGREAEYARIALWIEHGPFARRRWGLGLMAGLLLPLGTLGLGLDPAVWAVGAVLALIGLYNEEDLLVRAGQALPIS